MAALVRIKRHLDEDPLESLILNCKRRKFNGTEHDNTEEVSTVFQLAGTSRQDEHIENVLKTHRLGNSAELRQQFKKHEVNISEKLRKDIANSSKSNRYRVVNCFRKTFGETEQDQAGPSSNSEVTVFDLETDCNKNNGSIENQNMTERDETKFVYDFYYTSSDDFGETAIEDYVSVYTLSDSQVFGSFRNNDVKSYSESDSQSEDSNAEDNWRNEYPDEDDLGSINEEDMVQAVNSLDIVDELSSDSGEEDVVYNQEEEDLAYDPDRDLVYDQEEKDYQECEEDINLRYDKLYAKFKANNAETSLASDLYYGDIDEEEYYY